MGYIFISNYNPLNFTVKGQTLQPGYNFKHMDAFQAPARVLPHEQAPCWKQKWNSDDIIFLQFEADYDPIGVRVVGAEFGEQYLDFLSTPIIQIGSKIFLEAAIDLSTLPKDYSYRVEVVTTDIVLESNVIHVKQNWPGTLLYKYSHNTNKGLLWQTGIYFLLRMEGYISLYNPIGERTIYLDTPYNSRTVKGYSARAFMLFVGGADTAAGGIPDEFIDKIQDIFDCNNVELDGKGFSAKDESAKLTPKREDDVAWAGWQIEITETVNRRGKRFETQGIVEKKVLIDYIVEGKLFGPISGSANNNTYTINTIG